MQIIKLPTEKHHRPQSQISQQTAGPTFPKRAMENDTQSSATTETVAPSDKTENLKSRLECLEHSLKSSAMLNAQRIEDLETTVAVLVSRLPAEHAPLPARFAGNKLVFQRDEVGDEDDEKYSLRVINMRFAERSAIRFAKRLDGTEWAMYIEPSGANAIKNKIAAVADRRQKLAQELYELNRDLAAHEAELRRKTEADRAEFGHFWAEVHRGLSFEDD